MMWCSECQADVSPASDAPSSCGRCGSRLRMAGDATIREARDIISRWSSNDLLDRITSLPAIPEMSAYPATTSFSKQNDPESSERSAHDREQHEQNSKSRDDDADQPNDEFDASSQSILEEIDKLAQKSQFNTDHPDRDSPYLKLNEIDRPGSSEPRVDVSNLFTDHEQSLETSPDSQSPVSPQSAATESAAAATAAADRANSSVAKSKLDSGSSPESKAEHVQAPLLSSLLQESKAESVGQLAWWNLTERRRSKQQARDSTVQSDDSQSSHPEKSDRADQPAQLTSARVQTKNGSEAEAGAENAEPPANLSASVQSAQKSAGKDFSTTDSEEEPHDQPILPKDRSDVSGLDDRPATSERQRMAQPRRAQRRRQRVRNLRTESADSSDVEQKGTKTVSRKYRVDNPNPEPVAPASGSDALAAAGSNVSSNSNSSSRRFRIDGAEQMHETLSTGDSRTRTQGRSRRRYIDEPHADAIRGPHFEVVGKKRSNLASMTGQLLAYLGVLGLTVGTAIVIYGHFGGVSEYTPTGWLVTTVAQMMLFLGVINLVSGGIEQNNDEVSTRINTLGEQLMRIEQVTEQALKGPKIAASRYANPDAAVEETRTRESVEVKK